MPDTVDTTNISSTPSLEALTLPDVVVLPMSIQSALFFSTSPPVTQYQGSTQGGSNHQLKVFVAYVHRDKVLFERIITMLDALQNGGVNIEVSFKEIPKKPPYSQIQAHDLLTADLILPLVSVDLLATGYCYCEQMRQAVKRHEDGAWVAPILLARCSWHLAPFAKLASILPFDDGEPKPVSSWPKQSDALDNISSGIECAIDRLQAER